ncbi:MAG: response regulator [Cyclobacteriaceae bacterium]
MKKETAVKKSASVLLVDDEPNILLSLEFLMKKNGFNVFIGRDGREALDTIEQEKIDLVILDIMMPEVDGYEVCRRIRESPDTQHIKIIFLSAKIKEEEIQAGYRAGADLYITKPFSTRKIVEEVKNLLG